MSSETVTAMTATDARNCCIRIRTYLRNAREDLYRLYTREGWKALNYASWRECVTAEFQTSQSEVYRQLTAAMIETVIDSPIGENRESRLRPMSVLSEDEQRIVWQVVQQTAPDGKVTAAHVQSVVSIFKEVVITGAMDNGNGESCQVSEVVKAAVIEETYERMQRQSEHIKAKSKDKPFGKFIGLRSEVLRDIADTLNEHRTYRILIYEVHEE